MSMPGVALVVIAKAPTPGRSKTRLCPPCTPLEAAALAEAALADTLTVAAAAPVSRRILALDGDPGPWLPRGFEVVRQRGGSFGERLARALEVAGGPALVIGMDTPQITVALLRRAAAPLGSGAVDAVIGGAADGGYWAIGLREPDPAVFEGVSMSSASTGAEQRRRLHELGLRSAELPVLRDVDTIDDARAVEPLIPASRFARALRALEHAAPVAA